jgi:hypothetical protein
MRDTEPFKGGRVRRLSGWFKSHRKLGPPAVPGELALTPEAVLAGLEVEINLVRHALESVRRDRVKPRAKTLPARPVRL